jgi:hypothetical protein
VHDYNQIFLSTKEFFYLQQFRFQKYVVCDSYKEPYSTLRKLCLINPLDTGQVDSMGQNIPNYHRCALSEFGRRYLIYRREQFFKGKFPVIIAFIALIKSFDHEIYLFLSWLQDLFF